MKRSIRRTNTGTVTIMPYRCGIAVCITVCTGLLLLLLSAAIAYSQDDPAFLTRPLAITSLYVSVLAGGYIAAKGAARPIISALVCSIGTMLVLMLLSLIPLGKGESTLSVPIVLSMYAGVAGVSVLGALIGMKKTKKRSTRHKSRRR